MLERHAAHEEGWVDACYHPNCEWVEITGNADVPGRTGGIDVIKEAGALADRLFPKLATDIISILADGNKVALEVDFTGERPGKKGTGEPPKISKYKMAIFLTFQDGLIIRHVDYVLPAL